MTLTEDQLTELAALGKVTLAIGHSFIHVLHRDDYYPMVATGLVEWTEPHPEMGESFARIRLTGRGAKAVVDAALADDIKEYRKLID